MGAQLQLGLGQEGMVGKGADAALWLFNRRDAGSEAEELSARQEGRRSRRRDIGINDCGMRKRGGVRGRRMDICRYVCNPAAFGVRDK